MTGVAIRITPQGIDDVIAALAERADENAFDLWDKIGAALVASTVERFETETDPEGSPWPASLRKLLEGGRTLTVRGASGLVGSITHEATGGGVAVGTNEPHGAIHQHGGTIRAKTGKGLRFRLPGGLGWRTAREVTIPRRAFLGLDDDDRREIRAQVAAWLGAEDGE